jgi:large subunit ribosomal protein L9
VVNVRTGFARNYLLPRALATQPSDELIKQLAAKRVDAQKHVAEERKGREAAFTKLKGVEITLVRSVNDQGVLYGAVTQQDIATALKEQGHDIKPREVRIAQTIKRIDSFDVHVKLDNDLDTTVRLHVKPDRELEASRREETEKESNRREERAERSDPKDRWEEKQAARRNALDAAIAMALTDRPKGFGGGEAKAADAGAKDTGKSKDDKKAAKAERASKAKSK